MKKLIKKLYALIPFKSSIFSILRIVWKPKKSIFQHLHFKGVFTVCINKQKKFKINHFGFQIENEIFWRGLGAGWEKESLKVWIKLCEEAQVIIDIGANTGVYALVAKTINPRASVYAFEPHPMFFECLQKNIRLNNFDIKAFNKAVSDSNRKIEIDDYAAAAKSILVDCQTLDTFVQENNLSKIDLMKIDVETHEPQVLAGFSNYLTQFKPTMLIEILNQEIAEKVNNFVRELGYLYFNINEKTGLIQTAKIEQRDFYNYLLCSPETAIRIGLKT
ncbi:MAG: FkbM family methyltransferase [Microscillaceae bacterium]|nr:FkbM family methyltransferase [Microscillaceae bacterium]MDW8461242.1 FkbM family methyltransferase [Cytophagales bacterium]